MEENKDMMQEEPAEQPGVRAELELTAEQEAAQREANAAEQKSAEQSQWQSGYVAPEAGAYTYQSTGGAFPGVPPRKDSGNKPLIIAASIALGVMLLCCILVVVSMISGITGVIASPGGSEQPPSGTVSGEKEPAANPGGSAQRDDETVYNMPEITTEKKSGETLSLVEINKKVKNSVVGILIGEKGDADFQYSGSGFIISKDGYILTNNHVVEAAERVQVMLCDGITEYDAVIVGKDSRFDLAILKIEASGLSPAELGDSDQLEVGETVAAIGNPAGMELAGTVTDGIVSALNRKVEINGSFMTLIQTNASINPGNSGGPLVNAYGQVIGITSSKFVAMEYEGIGFAIPINHVVEVSEELITYGYIKTRAYIGIQGSDLTAAYAKYHGLPQGVYVSYVDPACDAAKKGLKEGDVIIGFNGKELISMAELNDLKDSFHPGNTVNIRVWRNNEEFDISVKLTEASE